MSHQQRARRTPRLLIGLGCILAATLLGACDAPATPTPEPTAAPAPTATPSPLAALDGLTYLIQVGDAPYGVEVIHAEMTEQGLIVLSEIYRHGIPGIERRTVVLSPALNPLQYTIERVAAGGRSYWLAVRDEGRVACLANNVDWFGPVFHPQISPSPELMIEGAPSALPYVLAALRFAMLDLDPLKAVLRLQAMDLLADLPESRPLDIAGAPEEESVVIGTVALRGSYPDDASLFTLWYEPHSRILYSARIPAARWDPWWVRHHPHLAGEQDVSIRRVREAPELSPTPTPMGADRTDIAIPLGDGQELAGTLTLPEGQGPFPCLVLQSVGGLHTRWDPGNVMADRGWATLSYDPRGLGQSDGRHAAGELAILAEDASRVGAWAADDPRLEGDAVFLVGIGESAYVAATVMAGEAPPYAGAIIAPFDATGSLVEVTRCQMAEALAPYYGWDRAAQDRYLTASLGNWQAWLLEGEAEVALLGRRLSLRGLRQWSETDTPALLGAALRPMLYLYLEYSPWVCGDEPPSISGVTVRSTSADLLSQPSPLPDEVAAAWVEWASSVRSGP